MDPSEMQARKDQARALLSPWAKQPKLLAEIVYAKKYTEKPFRFTDLPGEIQNKIYRLVLLVDDSIELWPRLATSDNVRAFRSRMKEYKQSITPKLKLLRVSKLVNKDAASIFYGENEFRFTNTRGFIMLQCFLDTIGKANAARLRRITVHAPLHGEYRDVDGGPLSDLDNLPDSASNMDHLRSFLRSAHMRIPRVRYHFNVASAVDKVCSTLAGSEASGLQIALVLPLNFHVSFAEDDGNGGSTSSTKLRGNLLGQRPTVGSIANALRNAEVSLVFLGWSSTSLRPYDDEHRRQYLDVHQQIRDRAENVGWRMCEALVQYDGEYSVQPFNMFRFKTLEE